MIMNYYIKFKKNVSIKNLKKNKKLNNKWIRKIIKMNLNLVQF